MGVDQLIADLKASGKLQPETADWLLSYYRGELAQHGDEGRAKRAMLELLARAAEQRRQQAASAPPARSSIPVLLRVLQSVVGAVLGAALAAAAAFALLYGLILLIETIFGSTPSRVRVPVKGVLAVAIAPIAGAILGAMLGWKLDARVAWRSGQQYLDTASFFDRAWMAWAVVWTGFTLCAFAFFDPFGRYRWRVDEWLSFAATWMLPILGGWLVTRLVRWVGAGRR